MNLREISRTTTDGGVKAVLVEDENGERFLVNAFAYDTAVMNGHEVEGL